MRRHAHRRHADVYGRAVLPLLTAAEALAADRDARERHGVPERVLMENAGRAAALVLTRLQPRGRVVGLAGSGNNGGDLLVMLRVLRTWGRDVAMVHAGSRPPDPALAHGVEFPVAGDDEQARLLVAGGDVVVDGMLGTGATGAPRGSVAEWIDRVNATSAFVLSLDLPSGVDASTGRVPAAAVRAHATVSFGWPKLGLLLHPARQHCGRLVAVEIGFPDACAQPRTWAITPDLVRATLPRRAPDAHKGTAGRLLVLAGSTGMAGAAALSAGAAIRAGAGLVRIASSADNRGILQGLVPEATFLDAAALQADDVAPMHALVAGPGLGTSEAARAALERALEGLPGRPTLLDADALNLLAEEPGAVAAVAGARDLVITPHARELARLTGWPIDGILEDAPAAARAAAAEFGCTVLLKGQPSLVSNPAGELHVNTAGSSDTAAAGTGDQLAGTIGAFLAGGTGGRDAALLGLFLSARAADLAGLGRSLTPRDISERLPHAFNRPGPAASPLRLPFISFDQPERR